MKQFFITTLGILCSLSISANEVSGIVVSKSDGSNVSIALSELRSIKFSEESMIVNGKDDSQQFISLTDITGVTFSDIATAVSTFTGGNATEGVVITDLAGRIVYAGTSDHSLADCTPEGIYIITANGKSRKVRIGR